jgi:DNA-directed RNA polymerase specialized sigma24 family protein
MSHFVFPGDPEYRFSPEALFFGRLQKAAMRQAARKTCRLIANLPEPLQFIVLNHFFNGRPLKEIGDEMGWSEQQVANRLQEALTLLRERLGDIAEWFEDK